MEKAAPPTNKVEAEMRVRTAAQEFADALAEYAVAEDKAKRSRKKVDNEALAVRVHATEVQFHLAVSEFGSLRYEDGLDKSLEIVKGMLQSSKFKYQTALAELQDKKDDE